MRDPYGECIYCQEMHVESGDICHRCKRTIGVLQSIKAIATTEAGVELIRNMFKSIDLGESK